MSRAWLVFAALALGGCRMGIATQAGSPAPAPSPQIPTADAGPCSNDGAMMQALSVTCSACHTQGPRPFFSSFAAFENLLVSNPAYIVPGHPEQSYFIQLLSGTATGTLKQMPISGPSFAQLDAAGQTQVSLAQVEAWVTSLSPVIVSSSPDPSQPSVSRLSAEQLRATLFAQLGLSLTDFFIAPANVEYGTLSVVSLGEDNYPVYGADEPYTCMDEPPMARHAALGGAQSLNTKPRDLHAAPPFAEALIPMSQRYCKMAIAKPGNVLLFPYVSPSATSASAAAQIQQNIGYLSLHLWGEPATDADVQSIFANVFKPIESASDPLTAWAGVCSYFVRHPKWIFF